MALSDRLRAALSASPRLRAAVKSRAGQYLVQTLRGARTVQEPVRFVMFQSVPRRVGRYHLRGSGFTILVRHNTRDIEMLNEIFGGTGGRRMYEPPPELLSVLGEKPSLRVLDLGANIGLFGAYALTQWPNVTLTSYEPDPHNLLLLEAVVKHNGLSATWSIVAAAVANRHGEAPFQPGLYADSHVVERAGAGTIVVPTVDLLAEACDTDLVKMDIEGAEWMILGDSRLEATGPASIVIEWHREGCPEQDPRGAAARRLRDAGYTRTHEVFVNGDHDGMLWAWREESGSQPATGRPRPAQN